MNTLGMTDHWQLDGGILKYFEAVGGDHFEGQCTVFDERRALDTTLAAQTDRAPEQAFNAMIETLP
jgi:UPF0176 protein